MSDDIYSTLTRRIDEAFERFETFHEWLNYAVYLPLQGILDTAAGELSCKRGCSICCSRLVVTSRIEALALADYIFTTPGLNAEELREGISAHSSGIKEFLNSIDKPQDEDNLWFTRNIPCPFLVDSSCSVYAGRPLSCRIYHSLDDARRCRMPVRDVKQSQMLLDAEALFQMMIYKIAGKLDQTLATSGILSILMDEIIASGAFKRGNP